MYLRLSAIWRRIIYISREIEVIVPDPATRVLVNERISKELEYGIVKETTVEELKNVIQNVKNEHGIEALILGCTELPLALNDENFLAKY